MLRRLLADADPRVRPDALEAFNPTMLGRPWHGRVVRFADEHGLAAVGNSDAHAGVAIGTGWTTFPGRTADDLRAAILDRHDPPARLVPRHRPASSATFGGQLRKYSRDARADRSAAEVRRDGTGRDLGYPGGTTGRRASRRPGDAGTARDQPRRTGENRDR